MWWLFLSAAIAGVLAGYVWQNRKTPGASPLAIMLFILCEWTTAYILELAGTNLETKRFWDAVKFIGVTATPVFWLVFAMEYTTRKVWANSRRLLTLFILPFITDIVIITNPLHGLFRASHTVASSGDYLYLDTVNGPWFWVHAAYTYTLVMIGLVLIVRALLRWPAQYRGQMVWVLLAALTPLISNIISVFQIFPVFLDLTPFAFTVTGVGMAYALFRHRLLDLAPIARDIVIDGMNEGMIVLDGSGRIVDINLAASQMIKLYSDKQPIGGHLTEVLTQWRAVANAHEEVTFGEGNDQRWFGLNLSVLRDEHDEVLGRVILVRDITDRKLVEKKLRENEARFRQIVENANDLIYRADVNGDITYANPAVLRVLGFDVEEILGRHYLDLTTPEFRHKVKRAYEHQYVSKTPNTYHEFPISAADGTEIWFGQSVQLIFDASKVVGFQAVARDITAIIQAQESLRIARDQALEASRAKSQLISKVSHELRTPLGGILGYGELLRDGTFGDVSPGQHKAMTQILESVNYLSGMVNELLDEAQLTASTAALQKTPFSPVILLRNASSGMEVLAGKKGLKFEALADDNLPDELIGDERRLRQIMINLMGNAIKFTREGSVSIRLFRPTDEHWAIQVVDTGMGIPKEAREYIFEPFRQVDAAITRDNRGVGLGLSITKQFVELMGGRILLESETGKGSTFTIVLPIIKATGEKP